MRYIRDRRIQLVELLQHIWRNLDIQRVDAGLLHEPCRLFGVGLVGLLLAFSSFPFRPWLLSPLPKTPSGLISSTVIDVPGTLSRNSAGQPLIGFLSLLVSQRPDGNRGNLVSTPHGNSVSKPRCPSRNCAR